MNDEDTRLRTRAAAEQQAQARLDLEQAVRVLRGEAMAAQDLYDLAGRLRRTNHFGHARRLYGRLWDAGVTAGLSVTAARVGQDYALSTYRDPDLPAAHRFDKALEILDAVDRLDLAQPPVSDPPQPPSEARAVAQRQESLGLRGSIYKRRWQIEGQRADLERSLGFYLKGYQLGRAFAGNSLGVETDHGYTGINAAFVMDLLAREDAEEAKCASLEPLAARRRYKEARRIRQHLAGALPQVAAREAWLTRTWWFQATLAEAYLGLGNVEAAVRTLREYNAACELGHDGPPLDRVPRWEFESTLVQLSDLGQLHVAFEELLGGENAVPAGEDPLVIGLTAREWLGPGSDALRAYLGDLAPALDRARVGKVGLALSGGGFRASFFHIGVLAYLAERDALRRVEVLSCVSGGSIVGAHFYLELQRMLQAKRDAEVTVKDYLCIVQTLEREFLKGVQTNIRSQVFGSIWANLRAFLQPGYTTTRRLGVLYERALYSRVKDGRGGRPRYLNELFVQPLGEDRDAFQPKYDNWRRSAKVPMLVINATTLNTGHNWQFTASWMGEPPFALAAEVESNYELRRMYHSEAPRLRNRWRPWFMRPFAPPDYQNIRLGEAVAASSCVPGLFEPIVFPDLYEGKTVRLVDGGVHDNQGIASLLEQDCNVVLVSDASGQMEAQDQPKAGRLGVSLRSFNVSMTRVRQAQYRELAARLRSGLIKGLMFLHLKRGLDAEPVDWRECQDPPEALDRTLPAGRQGPLTPFGLQKSIQRLLAGLRTDLDSFTDLEAMALMTSGYRQAEKQFPLLGGAMAATPRAAREWRFLRIERALEPGETFEEVQRHLEVGAQTGFKVWRLVAPLRVAGVLLLLAAGAGAVWFWQRNKDMVVSLGTVGALGWTALFFLAGLLAPQVVALIRYRQTIRGLGLKSLLAVALALVFKLHLVAFDRIFVSCGALNRFVRPRPEPDSPHDCAEGGERSATRD